jgi:hypothetical protein
MEEVFVRQAVQTPLFEQAPTLASFLELLTPGSSCFCCGHPLTVPALTAVPDHSGHGPAKAALTCARCGAGVYDDSAAVELRREPALAAA